jgi:glycosyltransferase involved in cell wall biosynthesis
MSAAGPRRPPVAAVKFHTTRSVGRILSAVARARARRRRGELTPDRFTVLTVNWNTTEYLTTVLAAIERFSPPGTEIVVVDNASRDDPRSAIARPGLRCVRLPLNVGHGPAMDVATSLVTTEFFATLDVDAFPVRADWLDELRGALDAGNAVVGGRLYRDFAHPSMLAMRTRTFRDRDHTFIRSSWISSEDFVHGESWDVGELISRRERPHVALVEASEVRGPGVIGTVYGGIVYHNGVSAHGKESNRAEGRAAWQEACARFLA